MRLGIGIADWKLFNGLFLKSEVMVNDEFEIGNVQLSLLILK